MQNIIRFSKRPKLKNPILIAAWPGMGEVAYRAANYLVERLKMEEFAQMESGDFFYHTGSSIQEGILRVPPLPFNKFYYFKNPPTKSPQGVGDPPKLSGGIGGSAEHFGREDSKSDLVVFLSNAQPDLSKAFGYCQSIIKLSKDLKISLIFTFAAMPIPIDHTQESGVWAAATNKNLLEELKKYNLKIMSEGQISGMNGLFLGLAKENGLEGICLLGEIPLYTIQIANPKSSLAVLEATAKIIGIKIDTQGLKNEAQHVDAEIEKLVDYLKASMHEPQPIDEDEIQRLKKALSQYTKLPESVKTKIEVLFEQAKKDISKANELKQELDKWSTYKDYEDRFLDLFKKPKDKPH